MLDKDAMETHASVTVDEKDRWLVAGESIENDEILLYFKKNLRNHNGRYYIFNQFGPLKENAFLEGVYGFPLKAVLIRLKGDSLELTLDSRETVFVPAHCLKIFDEETLGVVLEDERGPIPVRLTASAMTSLTDYLEKDQDSYYLVSSTGERIPLNYARRETLFGSEASGRE